MVISILQIVMLLGAVQGIIFSAFALFSKKYKSLSNFFLGMLILTFSYNIIQNYLAASNLFSLDFYFEVLYVPMSSLFLVLFYLYVKTFLDSNKVLSKKDYLLFIPFLISLTESIIEKIGYFYGWFDDSDVPFFNYFRISHEIFSVIYSFVLILGSYRLIQKRKKTQSNTIKIPKLSLRWLESITLILLILCIYWILPLYYESQLKIDVALPYFYILWIGLALTIYILGHIGLYHFGIYEEQKSIRKFSKNITVQVFKKEPNEPNEHIFAFEKFIKSDKNYRDTNLSLESVAEKLEINKSYLSRIINAELGKSFTDYVNELRIEEAKIYLTHPDFINYTLVSIGLEAGFNSKSTFNTSFKKYTGMTPSEYKKQIE